tara:strand:+ start:30 stop:191 length:162 start_codon:yes stop_codon:yes gene_type:complete
VLRRGSAGRKCWWEVLVGVLVGSAGGECLWEVLARSAGKNDEKYEDKRSESFA